MAWDRPPDLSPVGRYRYLVVAAFLIIYWVVDDDIIVLLRVWDSRQDPDRLVAE